MKINCLSNDNRQCPHCLAKDSLCYYHEYLDKDLYYCNKCYAIVSWNGITLIRKKGEAYPLRKK